MAIPIITPLLKESSKSNFFSAVLKGECMRLVVKSWWKPRRSKAHAYSGVLICIVLLAFFTACALERPARSSALHGEKPTQPAGASSAPALRLIVLTAGERPHSLARLLESACALLSDGDRVDMDVWIDLPAGVWHPTSVAERRALAIDIENLARNGSYRHGRVSAHVWTKPVGLAGQWLDAWHASIPGGLTAGTREIGLYLEDDVEISPLAWRWLKAAHAAYGDDPRVAGFSLQRLVSCATKNCASDFRGGGGGGGGGGGPDNSGGGFFFPAIGTWGFAPTARSFARFREWYYAQDQSTLKPFVNGILATDRFKRISSKASLQNAAKHMWSMYHLKYTDTHQDKYTVYVKCKNGAALAISYDFSEQPATGGTGRSAAAPASTHHESPPLLTEWDTTLARFDKEPIVLHYNGTKDVERSARATSLML